jgi:transglutaminase-like putative cysteine protease
VDSWRRNSTTDLPECYSQLYFTVVNQGTILYNLSWTTTLNGSSIYFKIENLTTGYNTVSWIAILSEYEDFGVPYNLRVYLTAPTSTGFIYTYSEYTWQVDFPRWLDEKVARLYITPNNPQIKELEKSIVGWPRWFFLCNWIASNINYPSDDVDGDGVPDYDLIYHGQREYWQLPIETLQLRTGDCEDFAILLCSLYRADGYDENSVFVVVGSTNDLGKAVYGEGWHAWVRINIGGVWTDIEPQDPTVIIGMLVNSALFDAIYQFNDVYFRRLK